MILVGDGPAASDAAAAPAGADHGGELAEIWDIQKSMNNYVEEFAGEHAWKFWNYHQIVSSNDWEHD